MGRNMLVGGEWRTDVESTTDGSGTFDRAETTFREWVRAEPDARFTPAAGRYHLYVARNCPWAHGAALVRRLAGLADAVTMDVVDPWREDDGWEFTSDKERCTADSVHGNEYLRDVYREADPEYTGRVTVPVLWDRQAGTVVNNESIEIMRMFATAFDDVGEAGTDLYPEGCREEVDHLVEEMYDAVNNGVYRAGFAASQAAYDDAVADVFETLDRYDELLAGRRYLAGDRLTLADVRLFPTLVRFDECYHTAFKCNRQYVHQYDHLWPYLRDVYQTPGVAETVVWDHVVDQGYYQGEITPVGPGLDYEAPHDRERLSTGPSAR
jgi:putative glutathione S-transferase